MDPEFRRQLSQLVGDIRFQEPLSRYTTFRTGGISDAVTRVCSRDEALNLFRWCDENHIPIFLLGLGSNLLISDRGFRGVMVKLEGELAETRYEEHRVIAGAGANLIQLSRESGQKGLSGLEFACAIPGTVGGALYMNAGAHGEEISGLVEQIEVLNEANGVEILQNRQINWQYRQGMQNSRCILTTILHFLPKNIDLIQKKRDNFVEVRKRTQPAGFSAGSVFRNPEGHKAYELIIEAGFSGAQEGGAVVSTQHANFIMNTGKATSSDIFRLIRRVQQGVLLKTGIQLQTEIRFVGEFDE